MSALDASAERSESNFMLYARLFTAAVGWKATRFDKVWSVNNLMNVEHAVFIALAVSMDSKDGRGEATLC